MFNHMLDRRGM